MSRESLQVRFRLAITKIKLAIMKSGLAITKKRLAIMKSGLAIIKIKAAIAGSRAIHNTGEDKQAVVFLL
jgi:hypothetical protein